MLTLAAVGLIVYALSARGEKPSNDNAPPPKPPPDKGDGGGGVLADVEKAVAALVPIGLAGAKAMGGAGFVGGLTALAGAAVPLSWLVAIIAAVVLTAIQAPVVEWRAFKAAALRRGRDGLAARYARFFELQVAREVLPAKHPREGRTFTVSLPFGQAQAVTVPGWRWLTYRDPSFDVWSTDKARLSLLGDLTFAAPATFGATPGEESGLYDWQAAGRDCARTLTPEELATAGLLRRTALAFGGAYLCAVSSVTVLMGEASAVVASIELDSLGPSPVGHATPTPPARTEADGYAAGRGWALGAVHALKRARNLAGGSPLRDMGCALAAQRLAQLATASGIAATVDGARVVVGKESVDVEALA